MPGPYGSFSKKVNGVNTYDVFGSHTPEQSNLHRPPRTARTRTTSLLLKPSTLPLRKSTPHAPPEPLAKDVDDQ
jgi:hypothetical protein